MTQKQESSTERLNPSRALAETRSASRSSFDLLSPGRRMEMAFAISLDALKLQMAGLKAQGFSESEIVAIRNGGPT